MRSRIMLGVGLLLLGWVATGHSQEVTWRAAKPVQDAAPVTLGKPLGTPAPDAEFFKALSKALEQIADGLEQGARRE